MKEIRITGKHNVDVITGKKKTAKRVVAKGVQEPEHVGQVKTINMLFMGAKTYETTFLASEIEKKRQGYKSQDIRRELYDETKLITSEEIVEKLVESRLMCGYCSGKVKVIFTTVRDSSQWTLDRIDNDQCHSCDNTVIACLKCNLQRRCIDANKFAFTKGLRIKKIID